MGFSYNKRKNIVELAVLRGCTALQTSSTAVLDINPDSENRDGDSGWPGMMSIRVYELDGMYDHPILPMAGEAWQLLEIQCHSRLAARRLPKSKKGVKHDGSDDNGDVPPLDTRSRFVNFLFLSSFGCVVISFLHFSLSYSSTESPLLWIRADPDMEYLAEVHFNQPVQMWVRMRLYWRSQLIFWSIVGLHFTGLSVLHLLLKFLIYLHYFSCLNIRFDVEVHQMRTKILVSNLCLTCHLIIKTELKELW